MRPDTTMHRAVSVERPQLYQSFGGQVGPVYSTVFRFFLCEWERVWASQATIFVALTHAPGLFFDKKAWNGRGEHLYERKSQHGVSITRGETTSCGTSNILGTGATFHLGPLGSHVPCPKKSARCQKYTVPCRFFSACK